jgi:hypothetical protein
MTRVFGCTGLQIDSNPLDRVNPRWSLSRIMTDAMTSMSDREERIYVVPECHRCARPMHVVYASPGSTAAYRKNGKFPDGAVLIKEVFDAETGPMTTGTVSHEQALKGWFVMVKDDKNSHPGNKLWGDGWGWSWFDAGNTTKTTSTDYHTDCQGCHVPARSTDWIYVQGYPVLRK